MLAVAVAVVASWFIWTYFRQIFTRSPLDRIPGPALKDSFQYGHLKRLLAPDGWGFLEYLTDSYPGIAKLAGPFGHRSLYVFDPLALHNIIVKEQNIFEENDFFFTLNNMLFGPGLLSTNGDKHKKQRKLLNPVFSIAHMRRMIPIFNKVTHQLVQALEARVDVKASSTEIDVVQWMGRTALELIGQAGLGVSFDPLVADKADELAETIKEFQPAMSDLAFVHRLLIEIPGFAKMSRDWIRRVCRLIPLPAAHKVNLFTDRLEQSSLDIWRAKKAALARGDDAMAREVGEGKDLMSILLRENMGAKEEDKLPEEDLIAQMNTFTFAAMDTTSNALSLTLTRLSENPDVQQKLREEILEALDDRQDLDYDELNKLPFLDAVCRETLRLHAPVPLLFRVNREDAVLPISRPIQCTDGTEVREIPVPKGTAVILGLWSSNRNKALWGEDAAEWKPERWLAPLPETIVDAKVPGVYSNLMTFNGGGRSCIGFKFSQLEMKVVLCLLLSKFTFAPSDKRITWNLAGVVFPTVAGGGSHPSMPMKLARYKPRA
ncbi:cytochrome P450 [Epithele typhae]|uniref:cytochrome P450 n=1 Tax=Epithele typhae TaxID=378194 RepID=UPI002008A944|nr:cytochrome P450 [Epithele typhae]KAH9941840.1 cytochrome P450 [Epithele typhae]